MKAAVYRRNGPPEVLQYEDVPDPIIKPGHVMIKVEAISIEGGDTLNRLAGPLTADPHIVGYQCAGTVVEVGDGVDSPQVGDRVVATMANGSHAELVVVPWQVTWQVPDGADLIPIACVPIAFGTAHDCLFEFGRLDGDAMETVLIQAGASGVGVAAIQLAHRAGATVMATASSLERLKPLHDLGLDHGIDYSQDNWVDEVKKYAPRGVDVVVDSVGTTLQQSLKCLGYRGRAITVGNAGRQLPMPLDISGLMGQNQSLTGVFLGAEMATPRAHSMIKLLIGQVAAGDLQVIVDRTFPLAEAAAAHAFIESRQAIGRVVLIP